MSSLSPRTTSLRLIALLFAVAAVDFACGSVSQNGDAGNAGSAGTTNGGAATAGASGVAAGSAGMPTHGSTDGGAGSSGSAGAHGGAGSSGSAGAHGGSDGGAGKDGGGICLCDAIYSPVCGVDGKDYASACNAACAGVAVAHTGGCVSASDAGTDGVVPLDHCDQSSDCTARSAGGCSCSQICVAKTDPIPKSPPFTCDIACPLVILDCGCVNHKCTAATVAP